MRTFHTDLSLGQQAEREMFAYLATRDNVVAVEMTDYREVGYDIRYRLDTGEVLGMEVKSLAGGYPTGCVEVWTDDAKTKRPHWADADIIGFKDRSTATWHLYYADEVLDYLETVPDYRLRRANNGCVDDSGWIVLFKWEGGMPGYITSFSS